MQLELATEPAVSRRKLTLWGFAAFAAATLVVVNGVATRRTADADLKTWTDEQAVPVVVVAPPDTQAQTAIINLPGRLEAYSQAQLYARVSGYVTDWKADIGAPVKAGEVLADIDAPDLDQQIMQARADVANAQTNATLSRLTLDRGQKLIGSGAISKETLDQRSADFDSKQAQLKSAQANLDRLQVLAKYKAVVAPFAGIVSARATDVGSLINAGSSSGPALFEISDVSRLRVYVNVPQIYAPSVKIGTQAKITLPEYPGVSFPATVEAASRTVDVASGSTRMQLVVDNSKGELMTGAYADVTLELPKPRVAINIPASALIFDQTGLHVATVDSGGRVVLKPVTIGQDMGQTLQIASGLSPTDRIVQSPPDGLAAGDKVQVKGGAGSEVASEPAPRTRS